MLDSLRQSASSWVVKLLIALLVLSFAVWGVADIFSGYGGTQVASVGDTEISTERYRNSLQREIQRLSQQTGNYLTLDQARSFGLDRQVLSQLVSEASLDEEARRRGMGMPDSIVAESIRTDPAFRAPGGQFDSSYFQQVLRANGLTEEAFVQDQRQRLMRQAIVSAVGGSPQAPETLARAVHRYRMEQRTARYVTVSEEMVEAPDAPDEEELRSYYEENVSEFTAPEYRRIALLQLEPQDVAGSIEISDEMARESFESRSDQFSTPERRTIQQIPFPTLDDAEAARAEIAAGQTFEEAAAERGIAGNDLTLGTLTREQIVDPAITEAAFDLAQGEVSDPVEGTFSNVLLRVTEIEQGTSRSYEEVAEEVKRQLALDRAHDEILDLYDLIEDDRAAGMTFEEIGERRDLPVRVIEAVDAQGRNPEGEPIEDLPDSDDFLQEAFASEAGLENEPLQIGSAGYLWYNVLDVTESRQLTFEEAREDVEAAWRADTLSGLISERASEIAERVRGGETLTAVAEDLGLEIASAGPLQRNGRSELFGQTAVGTLFNTPESDVAVAPAAQEPARVVFRVTDIVVPEYQEGENAPYLEDIASGISNDVLTQYLTQLQSRLGVSVNQQALQQVFGQSEEM